MTVLKSREIRLKKRPAGLPDASDFELAKAEVHPPGQGQVRVRNIYMSVDPYMRGRMNDRKSYVPPFQIGQPLEGGCVGQVVDTNGGPFQAGDYVLGMLGWREYYLSDGQGLVKIDPNLAPIQSYLGALGMTGFTAYTGLLTIGNPKAGETVFVSAAAGAVGSVVCQIAKLKGCRVVGSAGSDEKISWLLDEAGIDAAFNYKKVKNVIAEVGRLCPQGIDVYFENVGGVHLEAALEHMNDFGRIVMCGLISGYNASEPVAGPPNLFQTIVKRLTMQGFIVTDHFEDMPQFYGDMGKWTAAGQIKWKETVVEGLENAPEAFAGLFRGENFGKMLVKIGPEAGN